MLLAVSACGAGTTAAGTAGGAHGHDRPGPATGRTRRRSPARRDGVIVDVSGRTMQVQSTGFGGQGASQTAVTWTSATRFTEQATGKLSAIAVGDCVSVVDRAAASASPAATPSTSLTASTVRLISTGGSGCTFGGRQGSPPLRCPDGRAVRRTVGWRLRWPGRLPGRVRRSRRARQGDRRLRDRVHGGGHHARHRRFAGHAIRGRDHHVRDHAHPHRCDHGEGRDHGPVRERRGTTDSTGAVTASTVELSSKVGGRCAVGGFGGFGRQRPGQASASGAGA